MHFVHVPVVQTAFSSEASDIRRLLTCLSTLHLPYFGSFPTHLRRTDRDTSMSVSNPKPTVFDSIAHHVQPASVAFRISPHISNDVGKCLPKPEKTFRPALHTKERHLRQPDKIRYLLGYPAPSKQNRTPG